MINLVTGLPGAGKTLWTLGIVDALAKKDNRTVYYYGIPDLILDWVLMESPEDWINLPENSIIVIDECQTSFRPRAASVKPPPFIAEFETHRHKGLDFFLLTQHPMLVDGNIRRLAGKHFHVIRFYGFQKSTVHEFQSVRDNVDKNQKNSISTHFIFPKEVFKWYKSAETHTMKKRIPMRIVMIIILPMLLIGAIYYGIGVFKSFSTKPNELLAQKSTAANIANGSQNTNPNKTTNSPVLTYVTARIPVVADMPFTAPAYDKITEPVRAPYPAACLLSKSKGCVCYTDQATKFPLSQSSCKQIVDGGIYIDWQFEKHQLAKENKDQVTKNEVTKTDVTEPMNLRVSGRSPDVDSDVRHPNRIVRASKATI